MTSKIGYNVILFFSFLFLITTQAVKGNAQTANDNNVLKVGITGNAPFIVALDSNNFEGISLEVWEAIAQTSKFEYTLLPFENVTVALNALKNKKIDILVGPISITSERAKLVDFTQPYYQSSLSIMSRKDSLSFWERVEPFFTIKLLMAVLIFLFILGGVGTLLWLAERNKSPDQFPPDPPHGIANGMWLAIVTMSTTGYGDKAPITFWGRLIASCWMVISIIFATSMVAGIASTLTLTGLGEDTISQASQLNKISVAVLPNSPASDFVKENNGIPVKVNNFENAYQKLKDKKVDAVIFDRPEMLYFLKQNPDKKINISTSSYDKLGFGFALPLGSKLTQQIDISLLTMDENGLIIKMTQEWLGQK